MVSEHGIFPTGPLKYLLEQLGAYQDFTGRVLDDLIANKANGLHEIQLQGHPFIAGHSAANPDTNSAYREIRDAAFTFLAALSNDRTSGFMAELAAFVALCDTYLKHQGDTPALLLPKGRWNLFNYVDWEVDCQLVISGENRPIDVSNSIQHLMMNNPKIQDHTRWEAEGRLEPVLINRMSSKTVKELYVYQWDSMVCDVEKLVLLDEDSTHQVREAAERLEIDRFIYWIPRLPTNYGSMDGDTYNQVVSSERFQLHPEDFAPTASQLPDRYRQKITGLFRLLHVNSLYRQAHTTKERVLAVLMQNIYNYLLRSTGGVQEETVLNEASARLSGGFAHAFRHDAPFFRREISEYVGYFHGIKFLRRYGGVLSVPDAVHPLTYLELR